jgi:hypothetical protein
MKQIKAWAIFIDGKIDYSSIVETEQEAILLRDLMLYGENLKGDRDVRQVTILSNWPLYERLVEVARDVEASPTDEPIEVGEEVILRVAYGDYIKLRDALKAIEEGKDV